MSSNNLQLTSLVAITCWYVLPPLVIVVVVDILLPFTANFLMRVIDYVFMSKLTWKSTSKDDSDVCTSAATTWSSLAIWMSHIDGSFATRIKPPTSSYSFCICSSSLLFHSSDEIKPVLPCHIIHMVEVQYIASSNLIYNKQLKLKLSMKLLNFEHPN